MWRDMGRYILVDFELRPEQVAVRLGASVNVRVTVRVRVRVRVRARVP